VDETIKLWKPHVTSGIPHDSGWLGTRWLYLSLRPKF